MKFLGQMGGADVITRARSRVAKGTHYQLGAGGRDPSNDSPGAKCDCSGFVAWSLGIDRFLPNDGIPHLSGRDWFETTSIYDDARSPFGFVAEVPWTSARPGDVLVWPDRGRSQGHIGLVASVDHTGPTSVVHCSTGNDRRTQDAVAETPADIFRRNGALVGRVAWVS